MLKKEGIKKKENYEKNKENNMYMDGWMGGGKTLIEKGKDNKGKKGSGRIDGRMDEESWGWYR